MILRNAVLLGVLLFASGCGSSPSDPGTQGQGPALVSPTDGATVTGPDVTFAWDAVTGATKYYHQVASNASMQNPVETVLTSITAVVSPGAAGTWWWRVRASVSGQSTYTPWSAVWSFTLN